MSSIVVTTTRHEALLPKHVNSFCGFGQEVRRDRNWWNICTQSVPARSVMRSRIWLQLRKIATSLLLARYHRGALLIGIHQPIHVGRWQMRRKTVDLHRC
jgi:hypothetical protein